MVCGKQTLNAWRVSKEQKDEVFNLNNLNNLNKLNYLIFPCSLFCDALPGELQLVEVG